MRIEVEGTKEVQAALANMSDDIAEQVGLVVMQTAAEIEAGVKLRMSTGKATGRIYRRGGVSHQASAPGEAPAPDSGVLRGSIYHERTGPLSAVAGSRLAYASYLEFGTRNIAPRPAWIPEVLEAQKEFTNDIKAALSGVVR